MAGCEICGNDYDKTFEVRFKGELEMDYNQEGYFVRVNWKRED